MTPAKLARAAGRQPLDGSAFLDQMAADVGHEHVRRLQELRTQLVKQAGDTQVASFQPALEQVADTLAALDFSLLESRGLWASVTGKRKADGVEFADRYEALDDAAEVLSRQLGHGGKLRPEPAGVDRVLVEFEVEYRALDRIIEQGARWLHDMRDQLRQRQASAGADAAAREQIRSEAARCETLVKRLKALRAATGTAAQVHQHLVATAEQRASLLAALHKVLAGNIREWRARLAPLADAAAAGSAVGLSLAGPREVQAELGRRVQALLDSSERLREREQASLALLDTLGEQLAMAA